MSKQKILHVTFDMEMGGAEQVIRQLVENGDIESFELSVVCLDSKIGVVGKELQKQDFNIFSFSRQPGIDTTLISQVRTYIQDHRIDILHCHQYTPYVYGLLASFGTSAKVIFTEHGRFYPDRIRWKRYLLNPILSLFTDVIVCISQATADALVKYENFPRRKVGVVYNGIKSTKHKFSQQDKFALIKKLGLSDTDIILGTISRLDPIKNQKMMINAFALVVKQSPNVKLVLIGDGSIRTELEQHAQNIGVYEKIIFTGFIVNPQSYFCLIDVFLLPSLSEGTSMTLLEAMAFSIPCVVTDVGGNPEIVLHEETGLVVPNNDAEGLAIAILSIINSKKLSESLGKKGCNRYQSFFTVEAMVIAYQSLYRQLI